MTHLETMFDFVKKNGYECEVEDGFLYIKTTNDRFKLRMTELLSNSKDINLFHECEGEGWHKQGKHPWGIKNIQKVIYEHDGYIAVHRGRSKVIPPKRGAIKFGKSKFYSEETEELNSVW